MPLGHFAEDIFGDRLKSDFKFGLWGWTFAFVVVVDNRRYFFAVIAVDEAFVVIVVAVDSFLLDATFILTAVVTSALLLWLRYAGSSKVMNWDVRFETSLK